MKRIVILGALQRLHAGRTSRALGRGRFESPTELAGGRTHGDGDSRIGSDRQASSGMLRRSEAVPGSKLQRRAFQRDRGLLHAQEPGPGTCSLPQLPEWSARVSEREMRRPHTHPHASKSLKGERRRPSHHNNPPRASCRLDCRDREPGTKILEHGLPDPPCSMSDPPCSMGVRGVGANEMRR